MNYPANGVGKIFLQGLAVVLPVVLTIAVIYWLGVSLERALGAIIRLVMPDGTYRPGMGIAAGVLITFLAGLAMRVWAARRLLALAERIVDRIPLAKSIYGGVRDLMRFVSTAADSGNMDKVVLVTLADGIKVVGFVTSDDADLAGEIDGEEEQVPVYLQMSYQLGGYTVFVPRSRVRALDMDLEDAMRWVLTAGMSSDDAEQDSEPEPRSS